MLLTNNGRMLGGAGGVLLAILGSILIGQDGGLLLVGLVVLLAGVALVVRTLLGMAEASVGTSRQDRPAATGPGTLAILEGVKHMSTANQWIAGALMGVLALFGLFLFSRAGDGMFALFGGLLFLFGLAAIVVFVHQATDYSSAEAPAEETESPATEEHRPAA